jgi:DNA-binding CsgD family transcriptional regulator
MATSLKAGQVQPATVRLGEPVGHIHLQVPATRPYPVNDMIRIVGGSAAGAAQEVPEDGVILTDHSLRLIALDSRAVAILKDVSEHNGADSLPLSVPREVSSVFLNRASGDWSEIRIQLAGKRHDYRCTVYQLESQNGIFKQGIVTLYLQRDASPNSAILHIVTRCGLTPREEGVLRGISIGLTTKEVAQQLKISPNTVKTYLHSIMLKLGVTTRAAIVGKLLNCNHVPHHGERWPGHHVQR